MARLPERVDIEVRVMNGKSLRALEVIYDILTDLAEDLPWRDDVKRARRAAGYLIRHIDMIEVDDG